MSATANLTVRRYAHTDLPQIRQALIDVHADVYADAMDDAFNQRFPWFVDHWGSDRTFDCVIAYDGDEPVGFAYGAPSAPYREWWREHLGTVPVAHRTFAYSELAVRTAWRRTGTAALVTRALLDGRKEDLVVLLVDITHPRVQALYESWGFRKVGERRPPVPGAPLCAVMLAGLPLGGPA
ncbi:GNAT family N-acetyltransferase [Streptomyces yaizuensis]|uniref:GNAT family N-acetyltransferase n=1 Tax=Streptomyces yaizuensis TaxID=2989713 RepID=A0ABQ5P1W8_9ACTN|nr:GNAT family N-acetyltransferase [Streptomyces sp. YSPA8]GLF96502.1 GNAT family N-acetyltransferase [Streptomyces sp. YSPA8]